MPRFSRPGWVPKYRHHKSSGQAYVNVAGRDVWLGPFGSQRSRAEYDRVVAEWLGSARPGSPSIAPAPVPTSHTTVADLLLAFWNHAEPVYQPRSKSPLRAAFRVLRQLYGHTRVGDFQPLHLKTIQRTLEEAMHPKKTERKYCRKTINEFVSRIKQLFKWGVAEGLVPAPVWQALLAVPGLRYGRTVARESVPVAPVPDAHVESVLPHLPPVVADMVRVQRLTGARPGEICSMTTADLDTSGPVWLYRPRKHKTMHHGKTRVVAIGPRAQAVLRPYLKANLAAALFSPAECQARIGVLRRRDRKTPMTPSHRGRDRRAARHPRRYQPHYTPTAYARAIRRACEREGVPCWAPNQLRHTRATEIRRTHGLDGAGAVLGHAKLDTTQIYAERCVDLAAQIALKTG